MQIELMGCTSAGKSTLAQGILRGCRGQKIDIALGEDFVLGQVRLNWIKNHLLRQLLVNLIAMVASTVTWRTHHRIYIFAARFLSQLPITQLGKLNTLRNIMKRVGIYEIVRARSADQQIVLLDEGVLQVAHYLFVHVSAGVEPGHLAEFAALVPLPDVVVYLRQPESLLVDRTMERGHKRIPDRSYSSVDRFIKRAIATFDELAQFPAVESKLLVVDGSQGVRPAADGRNNPTLALASKIVQSGFAGGAS